MDIRSGNAGDVYWEVGRINIVGRRDTLWLLQEMEFFMVEGLSSTVRQHLVYGDPRCASFFFYIYIHTYEISFRTEFILRLEPL